MITKINENIVKKLNQLHLTLSTCESITGGAVASNLVLVENASKCFLGGFITYHPSLKRKFVNVCDETIKEFGTVSCQCAREMALGCQKKFASDIAIAVTGNASFINPIENKKSGLAYICIIIFDNAYDFEFTSNFTNKIDVINECVAFIYTKLWLLINNLKK